jgi:hypothetical protein
MRHRRDSTSGDVVEREYAWRSDGAWTRLYARTEGPARALDVGSEEEFITEHYWGYTRQRDDGTVEYRVQHPRWNVWRAVDARLDGSVETVYGAAFAEILRGPPRSAFVADGSPVTVFAPSRIR